MVTQPNGQEADQAVQSDAQPQKEKRTAVRSPLLFPVYSFGEALRIAGKVEQAGGGKLNEDTLAVALSMSVKSSGFLLRSLTARQFKLLQRSGKTLETTPLAKAILKPVNDEEKLHAIRESFLSIPLFNAVASRFKGQNLPQGEVLRNILERELRIPHDRVAAAERVLMDSAREAKLLVPSGSNTYLAPDMPPQMTAPQAEPIRTEDDLRGMVGRQDKNGSDSRTLVDKAKESRVLSSSSGDLLTISAVDLAEFKDPEFDEIWGAIGKIVKKRGQRLLEQEKNKQSTGG
jgi:hypothetical protein